MSGDEMIAAAMAARSRVCAPYSEFAVGAVLPTKSSRAFSACNIENISLGLTMRAKRVVLGSAISDGQKEFVAIYLIVDSKRPVRQCGACRQVLAEFDPALK